MPLLVERRLGERGDAVVARIEPLDESLDGPALAGRIAALEHEQQAGSELAGAHLAADVQAQLQPPPLERGELLLVLLAPEARREIEHVEATHRRLRLGSSAGRPEALDLDAVDGLPDARRGGRRRCCRNRSSRRRTRSHRRAPRAAGGRRPSGGRRRASIPAACAGCTGSSPRARAARGRRTARRGCAPTRPCARDRSVRCAGPSAASTSAARSPSRRRRATPASCRPTRRTRRAGRAPRARRRPPRRRAGTSRPRRPRGARPSARADRCRPGPTPPSTTAARRSRPVR